MTEKHLFHVQNSLFEIAKEQLKETRHVPPAGFAITGQGLEQEAIKSGQFLMTDQVSVGAPPEKAEEAYSIIAIETQHSDEILLKQLCIIKPQMEADLMKTVSMGMDAFGWDTQEACTQTLDIIVNNTKISRQGIETWMIKQLCQQIKAFAFIHVSESFGIKMDKPEDRAKFKRDLSQDPNSYEALTSTMETYNFRRMIKVGINREPPVPGEKRDSGKVVSLGELEESIDRMDSNEVVKGRFLSVLSPVD